jgi:ABC-type multidrug transport system fused ATPase/permease subunit
MKEGEITEVGSHAELMARGSYYATLVARQTTGFLEDAERAA